MNPRQVTQNLIFLEQREHGGIETRPFEIGIFRQDCSRRLLNISCVSVIKMRLNKQWLYIGYI